MGLWYLTPLSVIKNKFILYAFLKNSESMNARTYKILNSFFTVQNFQHYIYGNVG